MIIYSNGCSHTRGACRMNMDDSYISIIAKSLFRDDYELYYGNPNIEYKQSNDNLNFFKKKSVKNNKVLVNANFGKSNDLIFFETINTIYECKNKKIKIDYVIIQFSGPNRRAHSLPNGNVTNINPHDDFELGIKYEPFASLSTLQYLIILQELFEKEGIEYVFIPYMELDKRTIINNPILQYINNERLTTSLIIGHRNYFRKKKYVCDYPGHPNLLGNYILADKVLKVLGLDDYLIGFYDYFNKTKNGIPNYLGSPENEEKNIIEKYYDKLGDGSFNEIQKFIKQKLI